MILQRTGGLSALDDHAEVDNQLHDTSSGQDTLSWSPAGKSAEHASVAAEEQLYDWGPGIDFSKDSTSAAAASPCVTQRLLMSHNAAWQHPAKQAEVLAAAVHIKPADVAEQPLHNVD